MQFVNTTEWEKVTAINSKYPYIPDKKLYAAVMFACKMIRENEFFNRDCSVAANYYGVSEDDVRKEVRRRQAAGQTGIKRKKYKYYVVEFSVGGANPDYEIAWFDEVSAQYTVCKATSKENAMSQVSRKYDRDPLGEYGPIAYFRRVEEFKTKEQAKKIAYQWYSQNINKF